MPSKKNSSVILLLLGVGMVSALMVAVQSFSPSSCTGSRPLSRRQHFGPLSTINEHGSTICESKSVSSTMLAAKSTSDAGGKKKRRRKRKVGSGEGLENEEINVEGAESIDTPQQTIDKITGPAAGLEASSVKEEEDGSIPLPDIKDMLRRKKIEANQGSMDFDLPKNKIDRNDRTALLKVR